MNKKSRFAKKLRKAGFIDSVDVCDDTCFEKSIELVKENGKTTGVYGEVNVVLFHDEVSFVFVLSQHAEWKEDDRIELASAKFKYEELDRVEVSDVVSSLANEAWAKAVEIASGLASIAMTGDF